MGVIENGNKSNGTSDDVLCAMETLSRQIRVAVVGNVDAGKSTLIGTITTSALDDGRGRSRTCIMKHRHEIESGRTSTATTHLLGFREDGDTISGPLCVKHPETVGGGKHGQASAAEILSRNARLVKPEDEVAKEAHKIVTLMDLAGHEKYLKTTIHGVSSGMADYALILVNSRHPPNQMTKHHLNLCCSFCIPVIVVLTKVDGCPEHALKDTTQKVMTMLRSPDVNKKPFRVRNVDDLFACVDKLHALAPIIETSCVTSEGVDLLLKALFLLPKRRNHENKLKRPFEFLVEDIFFNVPGVGAVVSGFVNAGSLTLSTNAQSYPSVYVGPQEDGTFIKTTVKSAHVSRLNTMYISSGQSACLAFSLSKEIRKKLRRGMVVLTTYAPTNGDSNNPVNSLVSQNAPRATREFEAEICVLKGEGTTIRKSYQAFVHILNVRQSAYAKKIELVGNATRNVLPSQKDEENDGGFVLRPGSKARVMFEFAQRPEYVRKGMRLLFRDGRVRGVGIITDIPVARSTT